MPAAPQQAQEQKNQASGKPDQAQGKPGTDTQQMHKADK
jgi:hypothetical protein